MVMSGDNKMTDYQLAKEYLKRIALKFAEVETYKNWSNEFVVSEIREFTDNLKSTDGYLKVDPSKLSLDEAVSLGFQKWDDKGLMLIPLWLLPHLVDEFKGGCISGDEYLIKTSSIDNDHRFGCLSYGVFVKDND